MNNKKPFDPTKPVETRRGSSARIICTDKKGGCPIVALVETNLKLSDKGREYIQYYHNDGSSAVRDPREDLVNVPVRTSKFVNVYKRYTGDFYRSLDDALDVHSLARSVPVLELQYEDDEVVNVVLHKATNKQVPVLDFPRFFRD